jgi:dipeptidyl aminopeptidase/acylaminoacyl peptidase
MKSNTILLGMAFSAVLAAPWAGAADSEAAAAPSGVPAEAFFDFEDMDRPVISPDGSAIALLVRNKAGRRQLAVIDTADLRKVRIVAGFEEFDIEAAEWASDKRLVMSLYDESESAFHQRGYGLFAVDRDGENFRTLIRYKGKNEETGTIIKGRELPAWEYTFGRTLRDGSEDVVVMHRQLNQKIIDTGNGTRWSYEVTGVAPMRLNSRTGTLANNMVTSKVPDGVWSWAIDSQGRVRAAIAEGQGEAFVIAPDATGAWTERNRFDAHGIDKGSYSLLPELASDGTVYALHGTADAAGGQGLYRLDLATGKPENSPILSAKGFDVHPVLVEDARAHRVLGMHYVTDGSGTVWFDPALKALQAKVDARLPGLVNQIDPAACGCASRVLVTSGSDRQPALYFLYDRTDDTLIPIGVSRNRIAAKQMADTDFVRIKARDGNEIPVFVTKPHGKGPWPAVVLVHGGPWVRGWHWGWDPESQFLASRGYLVIKPEYRGSTGYGHTLYLNGLRQWGLAMQDDIADATTWAAKQGLADPARTCIAGASYGGYATLMGLVRYPELYRCGVAWAAVSDINLMYSIHWSDFSDDWKSYGMPVMIGDPVKDAAQLDSTSPLKQAAKISRPLLLAHGGVDQRVPIDHATKMRAALEANHAPVTWLEYKDEAHGWYKPENRADFYRRMETFLAAHIGPRP